MKRVLSILFVVVLLLGIIPFPSAMTVLSSQNLSVDGKAINCEKYNIDGSNYFKLRDIAYLLNGTKAQFAVGWDATTQTVSILTKEAYTKNGSELDLSGGDKSATAKPSKQTLKIDGKAITSLSVYNIGGNNYFKLRDLGDALGFGVGYNVETRTATIDSSIANSPNVQTNTQHTAEEVFKKCSPAVFYIEVFDANGSATATGSGFFIRSTGIAVTNWHVIAGCSSARITTADTQNRYDVLGVCAYNKQEDWAIIKVNGSGFSALTIGDSKALVGGNTVYAIGSPKGLQNTITQGIVSNPARVIDGLEYIQISAAISHGSSGGALITPEGEVVGITTAGYDDAEGLNFAVPISKIPSVIPEKEITTFAEVRKDNGVKNPNTALKSFLEKYGSVEVIKVGERSSANYKYSVLLNNDQTFSISYMVLDSDVNDEDPSIDMSLSYSTQYGADVSITMYLSGILANADQGKCRVQLRYKDNLTGSITLGMSDVMRSSYKSKEQFDFSFWNDAAKITKAIGKSICFTAMTNMIEVINEILANYNQPVSMADFGFLP